MAHLCVRCTPRKRVEDSLESHSPYDTQRPQGRIRLSGPRVGGPDPVLRHLIAAGQRAESRETRAPSCRAPAPNARSRSGRRRHGRAGRGRSPRPARRRPPRGPHGPRVHRRAERPRAARFCVPSPMSCAAWSASWSRAARGASPGVSCASRVSGSRKITSGAFSTGPPSETCTPLVFVKGASFRLGAFRDARGSFLPGLRAIAWWGVGRGGPSHARGAHGGPLPPAVRESSQGPGSAPALPHMAERGVAATRSTPKRSIPPNPAVL